MNLDHYRVEVDVRDDLRDRVDMQFFVDAICDALEERGYTEHDYSVVTHGPPELDIVVVRP